MPISIIVLISAIAAAGAPATHAAEQERSEVLELAQLITGTPEQKLQKLLRPHAYFGGVITDDIRAATGDPNIAVIDRRHEWGEIYSCNYIFMRGNRQGRTLVCE